MNHMIKPPKLKKGDRLAAVSLSWGGPGSVPARYLIGKKQCEEEFGIHIIEMPHTMKDSEWLLNNPEARADDLMAAFENPEINGIISTIGGDDSIRILKYLDFDVMKNNPKVMIGYSDTTISLMACLKANLTSFYGPSIMTGLAENGGIHRYLSESFKTILFSDQAPGIIKPNLNGWTDEKVVWADPICQGKIRKLNSSTGWKFLQGKGCSQGILVGGCIEVFEWIHGLSICPDNDFWDQAVLFLETSEEGPSPDDVKRYLRVFAARGILKRIKGLLFGRPGGNISPDSFINYDKAIMDVVSTEEHLYDLPVITGMDFGHTDPVMTLPMGVKAEIDCTNRVFSILENAVV